MIREGETGMTAISGDADDLARVLSTMAGLPAAARAAMGVSGRRWIANEFSAAAYRQRTIDLYSRLGAV